jgi:hypothetical protein
MRCERFIVILIFVAACARETPAPPATTSSAPATDPSAVSTAAGTPPVAAAPTKGTYDEGMLWLKSAPRFRFALTDAAVRAEGEMTRETIGREKVTFTAAGQQWRATTGTKGVVWERREGSAWKETNAPDYGNRLFQLVTLAIDPQKSEGAAQLAGTEASLNRYRFTNANTGAVHEVWIDANDNHIARMKIGEQTELTITP